MRIIPLHPKYPERTCWGCNSSCPADSLACGNGTIRTPHPCEVFGDDWDAWTLDASTTPAASDPDGPPASEPERTGG